ncbi:MAG: hypothetical protein CO094_00800 [Anaerolineae bacterium CG_4_9_14_3_um_filter_57_17]|nr:hypothetical protein [bacterium]NCT21215.1 hypothetical protein [bacterium]OIO84245.1 MAG: hypothetical protein AUK01_10105 [Anaerolineae bacterium CG2_30_57_67]PJB68591.1 MAG: hypothetical protein CO094_00800 [Anaerolineae bacterium CG_4_9_14_3_um_filter_57_17]
MKLKLRLSFIFITIIILTLTSLALQPIAPAFQLSTPTATLESASQKGQKSALLEIQPGKSDGIFAFGLLILLIILVPMFLRRKDFLY